MKEVLLMAALCMALALVFVPAAMAQSASAAPVPGSPECPEVRETADGLQCSSGPDISSSVSASPSAGREGDPCGSFVIGTPEADECYRSFGLEPLESPTSTASRTASPTASPSASASASVLPETGGPASATFSIVSLAPLVGTGIMGLGLVRRSQATPLICRGGASLPLSLALYSPECVEGEFSELRA